DFAASILSQTLRIRSKATLSSSRQLAARGQHVARSLAGTAGKVIAKPPRAIRMTFQHALKQAAWNPDYGGVSDRDRGARPPDFDDQGQLANQMAGAGDHIAIHAA